MTNKMKSDLLNFLNKIVNSEDFAHSENLKKLLQYLVNCSVKGEPAKETQIAADVFERDLTDNNQDSTIVRVNIHNLRKKLSHYYLTEGKNDAIQFVIPKGRYKVEFIEHTQVSPENRKALYRLFYSKSFQIVSILSIIAITSFFIFRSSNGLKKLNPAKSDIWKDFTEGQKPTMIVLGDYFFYKGKDSAQSKESIIRNYGINSELDLDRFLEIHPELKSKYKPAGFSYLGYSMPFILKELIPVFNGNDFDICFMSEFNNRYLQQYNIIFVGLYKTMGLFKTYFQHSGFDVDDKNNTLGITDSTGNISTRFVQNGNVENVHDDYAIVAKFPGPNHNSILLFSSFHDIGIIECVKAFSSTELFEKTSSEIKSVCGEIPNNFEVLIKVVGANRTDISSKILLINPMVSKTNYWEIN